METVIGFVVGFVLGTREGKQGLTKIRESWSTIRESTDVQHFVGEAATVLAPVMREVARRTGGSATAHS